MNNLPNVIIECAGKWKGTNGVINADSSQVPYDHRNLLRVNSISQLIHKRALVIIMVSRFRKKKCYDKGP